MTIPVKQIYPRTGDKETIYLKHVITNPNIMVYFNIGTKKMRRIAEDNLGNVAVFCGNRFLIVRPKFEEFILQSSEI